MENQFNFDNPADAALDPDNDGLSNRREFLFGTDPRNADTDGDGVSDGDEVKITFTNPLSSADVDQDGMPDDFEKYYAFQFLSSDQFGNLDTGSQAAMLSGNLNPDADYAHNGLTLATIAYKFSHYNPYDLIPSPTGMRYEYEAKGIRGKADENPYADQTGGL